MGHEPEAAEGTAGGGFGSTARARRCGAWRLVLPEKADLFPRYRKRCRIDSRCSGLPVLNGMRYSCRSVSG